LALGPLLLPFREVAPFPADALAARGSLGVAGSLGPAVRAEFLRVVELTEFLGALEFALLTAPSELGAGV